VQTVVIEYLKVIGYDKWNYAVAQTFAEHYQSPNTPVATLERVD
jgi:hypothetical protein